MRKLESIPTQEVPVAQSAEETSKPRVIRPLAPNKIWWIGQTRTHHAADAEPYHVPSDLETVEFWATVGAKVNSRDIVEVNHVTWWARCLIVDNDEFGLPIVKVLEVVELPEIEAREQKALPSGYRVIRDPVTGAYHSSWERKDATGGHIEWVAMADVIVGDPTWEQARARVMAHLQVVNQRN